MKRNNKGFTLIELLGAIVILGILIGVSVPLIVSLLDTSRNKMYINDAKKLVTQAEYKLKSNSSSIEKPDEGDCIAVSMVYLDSSDFDNPPNEGSYEKENSFVIIKNNGGKLEYSVTIVEKVKGGGYKGVELVKDSVLLGNDALSHVVNFKKSDLINVETDVNKGYINEKLGDGYISADNNLTAIYNYPDLDDSSSNNDIAGIPRITMASLVSTSSKGYNSLDATLQLKVEDKDTPRSNLKIYLAIDSGYENATVPIDYGTNDTFSYNINFANYGKGYDGSSVKVYIIVKDPDGNSTKKTMTYKIHKNEVPEIDSDTKITKRNKDKAKMTTGLLKLVVLDDVDDNTMLSVCFRESSTDEDFTSCDNYREYNSIFNADNEAEYKFTTCNGECKRDGSKHYLTVFVKDSLGGISKKKLSYEFSTNTAPVINTLSVVSQKEEFTDTESKTIVVNIDALDDIDDSDNMVVKIEDGVSSATYNYSLQPIYYSINSLYDGSTKNIKVSVIDSEGGTTSQTKNYTLYQNKKPSINSFSISSSKSVCNNLALCPPENGGSLETNVLLDASDDIDYKNDYADLRVCLSLTNNANTCSNYVSYSEFNDKMYSYVMPGDYDGSTKTIYAFVKDTYGLVDSKSYDYKIYKNQAPVIENVSFASKNDSKPSNGNLNTIFTIDAYDDFDDINSLKLQVIEDGVIKIDNANLSDYIDKDNDYKISGTYNGVGRNIEVKVIDTDSNVSTQTIEYGVYNNEIPEIEVFDVYSSENPCNKTDYCPLEDNGNYNAHYKIKLSDDLDKDEDIQICISSTDSCSNYSSYSNYYDENGDPKEFDYTFDVDDINKPYNGAERHLYLFAKDTNGGIAKSDYKYTLYKNKGPVVISEPSLVTNSGDLDVNIPEATFTVSAEDDFDSSFEIKYCHKKDDEEEVCTNYENYQEASKKLDRSFFNSPHPNGEVYKVYAKFRDSYGTESKTEEIEYKLYTDINPIIYAKELVGGDHIYVGEDGNEYSEVPEGVNVAYEKTKLKVFFTVDDPYDKVSVCFSENGSCTNYTGVYEANNCVHSNNNMCLANRHYAYYEKDGTIENGDHVFIELFVKDSYGNVSREVVYDDNYNQCSKKNEEDAIYEYSFNTNEDNNKRITIDSCQGRCYYDEDSSAPNNIISNYNRKITYTDRFNSSISCGTSEYAVSVNCSFKDCFYKNNNYDRYAIGTTLIDDEEPWISNVNGHEYSCTGHYVLYLTSYTNGKESITITPTNTDICKEAFDAHEYDYDSSSNNPFVRIDY